MLKTETGKRVSVKILKNCYGTIDFVNVLERNDKSWPNDDVKDMKTRNSRYDSYQNENNESDLFFFLPTAVALNFATDRRSRNHNGLCF